MLLLAQFLQLRDCQLGLGLSVLLWSLVNQAKGCVYLESRVADAPSRETAVRSAVWRRGASSLHLCNRRVRESPSWAKASGARGPSPLRSGVSILGFPTYLQEEEPGAAAEAKDVPDVDPAVGAGRDAGFVKEGAVGAPQVVEVEAGPLAVRGPVGAAPVLQHGVEARHRRVLQAHVAARQPPEKAATDPFQAAGAEDRAALQGLEAVGARDGAAPRRLSVRGGPGRAVGGRRRCEGPRLLLGWTPRLRAIRPSRGDVGVPGICVRQCRGPLLHLLRV